MNDSIYIVKNIIPNEISDLDFTYSKTDSYIYTQMGIFKRMKDDYFKVSIDHKDIKEFSYNNEDIKVFHEVETVQENDKLTKIPFQHFHIETVEEIHAFHDNLVITKITENSEVVSYRFSVTDINNMEDMNDEKALHCIRKITGFLGKL